MLLLFSFLLDIACAIIQNHSANAHRWPINNVDLTNNGSSSRKKMVEYCFSYNPRIEGLITAIDIRAYPIKFFFIIYNLTPKLCCVAHLRARTRHIVSIAVTHHILARAPLQVCHVSYSDLLDDFSFMVWVVQA